MTAKYRGSFIITLSAVSEVEYLTNKLQRNLTTTSIDATSMPVSRNVYFLLLSTGESVLYQNALIYFILARCVSLGNELWPLKAASDGLPHKLFI